MTDAPGPLEPLGQPGQPILDRLAFERFTAAHRRELKLHCYRMMGSLHEADDLVQDTFLRAWRGRSQFDGRGSVRGWLYTIATNSCLNALKAGRGRIAFCSSPDGRPPTGRPQAGLQPRSPGWSLTRTRSFQASLTASPVRKRGMRPARPCNSPSSLRSRICRPSSGPPCCFPTSWGGRPSRRRDCWAGRPLRSTAHCSGLAQRSRRDIPGASHASIAAQPRRRPAARTLHAGLAGRQSRRPHRTPAGGRHLSHAAMAGMVSGTRGDPGFLRDHLGQFCGLPHGGHRGQRPARGRGLRAHPSGPCVASPFPACYRAC